MSNGRNHAIFTVNGEVYNLRISYNALAEYNKIGTLEDFKNAPLPAYRGLVWAGINAYGNKSITLEQAGELCEDFILEKGIKAFQSEMERIVKTGIWLESEGRIDTGNPNPVPKQSENSSTNTSN